MSRLSPNLQGILLMTMSMALLASADGIVKSYSGTFSSPVILMAAGFGSFLIFFALSFVGHGSLLDRRGLSGAAIIRTIAEMFAAITMIYALARIPFTVITLVMQSMPFIVTVGAVIFFGEKVGWRRWSAIMVGFLGVGLILRPGAAGFSPEWLLALVVALCLSLRDLASRAVPKSLTTVQIAGWGGIAVFLTGLAMHFGLGHKLPSIAPIEALPLAAISMLLAAGVYTVSAAMRVGEVGVVAPFRYTRLPFGLLIAFFVFGERIDTGMIIGAAVIVSSGLYIFLRERGNGADSW